MGEQQLLAKEQGKVEGLLEQLVARFEAFETRQADANAAFLRNLESVHTRIDDTNKRIDDTNKRIDKYIWGLLGILIAQVGTLITILLKLQ